MPRPALSIVLSESRAVTSVLFDYALHESVIELIRVFFHHQSCVAVNYSVISQTVARSAKKTNYRQDVATACNRKRAARSRSFEPAPKILLCFFWCCCRTEICKWIFLRFSLQLVASVIRRCTDAHFLSPIYAAVTTSVAPMTTKRYASRHFRPLLVAARPRQWIRFPT